MKNKIHYHIPEKIIPKYDWKPVYITVILIVLIELAVIFKVFPLFTDRITIGWGPEMGANTNSLKAKIVLAIALIGFYPIFRIIRFFIKAFDNKNI